MTTPDIRQKNLHLWVKQQMQTEVPELQPLGGDAGFRRYFRFSPNSRWLAVDAPPATEDSKRFVQLAQLLADAGIKTPAIKAVDYEQGFLLVEDFGDQLVYHQINAQNAWETYTKVNQQLAQLQKISPPDWLEIYDHAFLMREMQLIVEWFIKKLLHYSITEDEKIWLDNIFSMLANSAMEQPSVLVHRDFHSRNLIICADQQIACIDFQGALKGPLTYDSVSLLRDCYLRWPADQVRKLALDFYQIISPRYPAVSSETFLKWFDWLGLQRHIKVLGIFARLYLRDGKEHYLKDLPLVIRYTLEVCEQYPELLPFAHWFQDKLIPLARQQSWYQNHQTAGDK